MPTEPTPHEQLVAYGAWLEEHLGTTLRPETPLVDVPPDETEADHGARRWAFALLACVGVIAVLTGSLALLSGHDDTGRVRTIVAAPRISIEWDAATSLFGGDTPYSLAGSRAGFLALTRPAEQELNNTTFDAKIWYSKDGSTWTTPTTPIPPDSGMWSVGATSNALWVVASTYRDTTIGLRDIARIYRTTDGEHWTTLTPRLEVSGPLSTSGDVLIGGATEDVMNGPYGVAASTNGQDWTMIDGFPGFSGTGSVARVAGVTYLSPLQVRGAPEKKRVMFASADAVDWERLPGTDGVLVEFGDELLAMDEPLDACGIPTQGTVYLRMADFPQSGTTTTLAPCDAAPKVHIYDPAARKWSELRAATKPVGPAPSGFATLGGQLVAATVTFDGNLVVNSTSDGGGSWQQELQRGGLSAADQYQSPMVATNGRDVVVMAPSFWRDGSITAVGHLVREPLEPSETPLPTEEPGPTLAPDTPSPGATDYVSTPDATTPSAESTTPATDPGYTLPDPGTNGPTIDGLRSYIDLPSSSLPSGASMEADWVVVNDTAAPIVLGQICVQEYMFHLEGPSGFQSFAASPECVLRPVVLAPGENRFPGTVDATTASCFTNPSQPVVSSCSSGGSGDALRPGSYFVVLTGAFAGVPVPSPVPLEVVSP